MIKVAEGSYKLANQKGFLTIYLTYCKLKDYNEEGSIKRTSGSISSASSFLEISTSTLRLHLTKLIKIGLVRRHTYSYSLVSYDKAWSILGIDISPNKKKERRGDFIIFKVNKESLREEIEISEIRINVRRQAYKARKSILKDKKQQFTDTEKKALTGCRFSDLPSFLDNLYVKKSSVLRYVENFLDNSNMVKLSELRGRKYSYTKITPYLTCERTSIILGYERSPRTGQSIRKRIQSKGLAEFKTREVEFLKTTDWKSSVIGYRLTLKDPRRVIDNITGLSYRLISKMTIF